MYCIIVENYGFLLDFQNKITLVQNQMLIDKFKVSESALKFVVFSLFSGTKCTYVDHEYSNGFSPWLDFLSLVPGTRYQVPGTYQVPLLVVVVPVPNRHSEKPLVPTYVEGTVRQNTKHFRIIFVVLRDTDTVI